MTHKKLVIDEEGEEIKISKKGMVNVPKGDIFDNGRAVIQPRTIGEFKDKAFYLTALYDWVLGEDSSGCVILVPIKKN